MTVVLPLATALAWFAWITPRLWHHADRRLARRRLTSHTTSSGHEDAPVMTETTAHSPHLSEILPPPHGTRAVP